MKALLQEAAVAWDGFRGLPELVAQRENTVFKAQLKDGEYCALRLHRVGYQSVDAIIAELNWTEDLAARGFRCPRSVRTVNGELLCRAGDGQIFSMVSWVDALPLAEVENDNELVESFFRLGRLLAELHQITDAGVGLGGNSRPAWQRDGLTGLDPVWGRYWENPDLSDDQAAVLLEKRDVARAWLGQLSNPDIGPIHADAIGENVLIDHSGLWLIDFDDAGTGYRLYDLGVALVPHWDNPILPDLTVALCSGYADQKGTERDVLIKEVPRFMALRALASVGWITSRASVGDPRHRYYIKRALHCARYLDDDF